MADQYDQYIPGIQYAETRGQQHPYQAVGDHGSAMGAFQIHPIMFQDIQQTYPQRWKHMTYQKMLADPRMQVAAVHDGLQMLEQRYKLHGDQMLSAWNTGPTAAHQGTFNKKYVQTVHQGMGQGKGNPLMKRFGH